MGEIRINDIIYGGVTDARDLNYDNENSKLNGINVQDAIDEVVDFINGIMLTINPSDWVEQADGTWKNTVAVEGAAVDKMLDVSLYGDASEDEAHAFDFLITSIDVQNDVVVFTASEKINIALNVILRGRMDLENKNVYVSDLSAGSINYDNSVSGLDATNVQNAVDEMATMVNGLVVNVSVDSWDLQEDGSYKKIIAIEQLTGNETLDVCLYPGDSHSEEQIVAFSELLSSIETYNGFIVLTAVEKINVSFRIFLYGKVNFDKNNFVALTDNVIEIVPISEEEFNKKSEVEKAAGNFLVDDGEEDEFLSARNIEFDGSEIGMEADNVHDAFRELNSKIDNYEPVQEQSGIISQFATSPGDGADDMLIEFPEVFNTVPTDFYCVDVEQSNMFTFTVKELTCSYAIVTVKSSLSWNSLNDFQWKAVAYNNKMTGVVTLLDNVTWANKTTHTLTSDINNFKYLVVRIKCNYTSVTDVFHIVNTIPVVAIDKDTQINIFDILIGTDTKLRVFVKFSDTTVYLVSDVAKYGIQNISIWGMN